MKGEQGTWKTIKARKEHECEGCCKPIHKGEMYDYFRSRAPKYDSEDRQIGIEYIEIRTHPAELNCHWPEECKKGNHVEHFYTDNRPDSPEYGDTIYYCVNCATDLSNIEK